MFTTHIKLYNTSKERNLQLGRGPANQVTVSPHVEEINKEPPKVSFFPESGKMVHGFLNKIGFKALDANGLGIIAEGEVFTNKGKRITTFKTNHLGMGFFYLKPDSTVKYHARISFPNKSRSAIEVTLPKVARDGSVLSVNRLKNKIWLSVYSSSLEKVFIKVSSRGVGYYVIEGELKNGSLQTAMEADSLPEGIIAFSLLDDAKIPHAERLYYNAVKADELQITLQTNAASYEQREKTALDLELRTKGTVRESDVSVMVVNKAQWHKGKGETIRSYFLLNSELRGKVEQPGYYFKKENSHKFRDLEALMLTQGWRNYIFPADRLQNTSFLPQAGLSLHGTVRHNSARRTAMGPLDLTLAVFGAEPKYYQAQTDSLGRFSILLDDTYGKGRRLILQANHKGTKKKNITFTLEKQSVPELNFWPEPFTKALDKHTMAALQAQERRNIAAAAFDSLSGVTQLDEVILESYKLSPARKKAYKNFGAPDVVIRGDTLRRHEKDWSYGLYSILLFNYPDQVQIERFADGFMLAHVNNGHTLISIDGRLIRSYEYAEVQHLSPQLIESVEIMQFVPFFKNKFLNVFPDADPLFAPALGHVIAVFTKNQMGLNTSGKPIPGLLTAVMDGFSVVKEFYAPQYDAAQKPHNDKPDLRSLIHWQPGIEMDKNGRATVGFYNGDIASDYVIIVEAISKDGRIGYQELEYRVKEKAQ